MASMTAMTLHNQYFTSFGWRWFFSVGFFYYWGKVDRAVAGEHLPMSGLPG